MMRKALICMATLVMFTSVSVASADVTVSFYAESSTVAVGQATTVDIMASFDEPVVGWGLDLGIDDPDCLGWIDTSIGDDWNAADSLDEDGLAGLRFYTGIAGDVLLATLTLEGLAEGQTVLTLGSGPEEDEGFLLEAGGLATGVTFMPTTITVVPEPTTVLLFVPLLALHRRR
ncbi:MAG: hypothetical protein JXO22_09035 [Phycisphaerae bacterium]|nr:hypothetical protein [Phycisphaerae bacterium]